MKKAVFLLFALLLTIDLEAQESQTAYNFLRIPVSAHAAALGGDNITIIEDDEALIFNNPALLSSVSDKTITLGYMNYMKGVNAASAAFNRNFGEKASAAVSAQYLDYGTMKQRDENNNDLGKNFVGGITAKFITSYIGSYNSMAMGVDLGINYYNPDYEWSLSAVAKNLGGQIKAYDDNYEDMPLDVQVGVSKRFVNMPFRVSATLVDLNHWNYGFINHAVFGLDLLLSDQIWIGAGYNCRRVHEMKIESGEDSSSHGAGLSIGAGLNLDRFKLNLSYGKYHVSSSSIIINAAYSL